jgi:protein transport protein SEC24
LSIPFRAVIEDLLEALPQRHEATPHREASLGSAIRAGLATLVSVAGWLLFERSDITASKAGRGGHVVLFQSILPTIGPGAIEARVDESLLYGTENEKQLYLPSDKFWQEIAEECVEEGIGVSMFLGNSRHIDVASIGSS